MKYNYKIIINKECNYGKSYNYIYNRTKVKLSMNKKAAMIIFESNTEYCYAEIITSNNRLFSNAIYKLNYLFVLNNSKRLNINSIKLLVNGNAAKEDKNTLKYTVNSIIGDQKICIPNEIRTKEIVDYILEYKKSKSDYLIPILNAYVISIDKNKQIEKLFYLWMTINGIYNYFEHLKGIKRNDFKDSYGIKCLSYIACSSYEETINKDKKERVAQQVIAYLKREKDINITKHSLMNGKHSKLRKNIEEILQKETGNLISADQYLMLFLPYYYRCSFFHTNKEIKLFSLIDEKDNDCYQIVNSLMNELIIKLLPRLFEDIYVKSNLIVKLNNLVIPKEIKGKIKKYSK